jgi:tetratricopeptide (TPR) repeat protein
MTKSPLDLVRRAMDLRTEGDLDGAIALMATGFDSANHSEHGKELAILANDLATAYEERGRPELAIEYVKKGLTVCPNDLSLLYTLARLLILTEQFDEARRAVNNFSNACDTSADPLQASWAELQSGLQRMLLEAGGS